MLTFNGVDGDMLESVYYAVLVVMVFISDVEPTTHL